MGRSADVWQRYFIEKQTTPVDSINNGDESCDKRTAHIYIAISPHFSRRIGYSVGCDKVCPSACIAPNEFTARLKVTGFLLALR